MDKAGFFNPSCARRIPRRDGDFLFCCTAMTIPRSLRDYLQNELHGIPVTRIIKTINNLLAVYKRSIKPLPGCTKKGAKTDAKKHSNTIATLVPLP
jgi:hypothetical protein